MIKLLIISYLFFALMSKRSNILSCGIIGFSGFEGKKFNLIKIHLLMYQNSVLRQSEDSTGIYTPKSGIIKNADDADVFLRTNEIEECGQFIGHVRSATVGGKSANNAHPFLCDNVVGVHNGTLRNHWKLASNRNISTQSVFVDSEVLIMCLAHDQRPDVFEEIEGAAAVLFTDIKLKDENLLYAFRNKERPLFRGNSPEGMYISSLEGSLKLIGCTDIKEFKEDYFYIIKNGKVDESPKKIKHVSTNTPAVVHTQTYPITKNIEDKEFISHWLKYISINTKIKHMTYGNYYLIEDAGRFNKDVLICTIFIVTNDIGKQMDLGKYLFDYMNILPEKDEIGVAAHDLNFRDGNAVICKKGDALIVTSINKKCLGLKTLKSHISFTGEFCSFKRVPTIEERQLSANHRLEEDETKLPTTIEEVFKEDPKEEDFIVEGEKFKGFKSDFTNCISEIIQEVETCQFFMSEQQDGLVKELQDLKSNFILNCNVLKDKRLV